MDDVDAAVAHTLKLRFEMGLFDPIANQPYWTYTKEDIGTADDAALNLKAAQESLVLVRNPTHAVHEEQEGGVGSGSGAILPLAVGKKIAVIGPHGNATFAMIQVGFEMIRLGHSCCNGVLCTTRSACAVCTTMLSGISFSNASVVLWNTAVGGGGG